MAYCNPRGIPLSIFQGRVVRPGVDPTWTAEDANAAVAYERWRAGACRSCGTRASEWEKDRFAYVSKGYACPGCELIEQARRDIPESAAGYIQIGLIPNDGSDE